MFNLITSNNFLVVAFSFLSTYFLLYILVPYLQSYSPDLPNDRSSHVKPVPRGGGVAFVVISVFISLTYLLSRDANSNYIVSPLLISLPLAIIGLADDRYDLPSLLRFIVQLIISSLLVYFSPLIRISSEFQFPFFMLFLACILITISLVAIINFVNFMDGLDGLVAGCMAVILANAAMRLQEDWSLWSIVGALLSFLVWNWSPAKVFMGDVGSTFLGAVFAGAIMQSPSWSQALEMLLIGTPLLGDACICVPRRLLAGQRVFQAHRLHLFQRLHQSGWPHSSISSLYIVATALLALISLISNWHWVLGLALLELIVGIWLDQHVAVPFNLASKR